MTQPTARLPRPSLLLTLLAALLLSLVPSAASTAADGTGTITGTVRHQLAFNGGIAEFGLIDVYDDAKSPPEYLATYEADSNGDYSIDLPPGTYGLVFYNSDDGGENFLDFFPELYREKPFFAPDPNLIKLEAGETVFVDSNLAPLFFDMFDTPFTEDIAFLRNNGITFGCNPDEGNTLYCPDDTVTRGQMAAFLVRAFGLTEIDESIAFDDIDDSPFRRDILRLATAGITRGCNPDDGNTSFCPTEAVTRGQMAAFMVRAFGMSKIDDSVSFEDTGGSIFENDILRLATADVTRGCNPPDNDRYCPTDPVTRGQMAAFLQRAFEWLVNDSAAMDADRTDRPARADLRRR